MSLEVPLFPLNTVLFPGMTLPLHIFERRYREMIGLCLRKQVPFGVALIRSGSEVGGSAAPHEVGTLARIVESRRLDDGRYDIVVVGTQRFRLRGLDRSRAYLVGEVELLSEETGDGPRLEDLCGRVSLLFAEYERLSLALTDQWSQLALPTDPVRLSHAIASRLVLAATVRQELLEAPTALERLRLANGVLEPEIRRLTAEVRRHYRLKYGEPGAMS